MNKPFRVLSYSDLTQRWHAHGDFAYERDAEALAAGLRQQGYARVAVVDLRDAGAVGRHPLYLGRPREPELPTYDMEGLRNVNGSGAEPGSGVV